VPNGFFGVPLVWVDTRSLAESEAVRGNSASLSNTAAAELVTRLVSALAESLPQGIGLGVIAAYADQRDLLRRLAMSADVATHASPEIDTVDAFEVREKDVIIVSLVRSNRRVFDHVARYGRSSIPHHAPLRASVLPDPRIRRQSPCALSLPEDERDHAAHQPGWEAAGGEQALPPLMVCLGND